MPDPASRFNPLDVHGPSEVIAAGEFDWHDTGWKGRPWEEAVIYELHVGTFTGEGTYRGVEARLDYLAALGVTAVELMPLADFPGRRGWGYDGVLPFAPDAAYGRPEDLKRPRASRAPARPDGAASTWSTTISARKETICTSTRRSSSPTATTRRGGQRSTSTDPIAASSGIFSSTTRLYWLEEFHVDGLRLDAVHAIHDESNPDILDRACKRGASAVPAASATSIWCWRTT